MKRINQQYRLYESISIFVHDFLHWIMIEMKRVASI